MKLVWTKNALNDFSECIIYLEKYFSEKTIIKFIAEVEYCLKLVTKNPQTFPLSDYKEIRYVVIIPNITLFFKIKNETEIIVVRIWNNKKNKSRNKIK
jgi:plasmid stabilization system protein ParE